MILSVNDLQVNFQVFGSGQPLIVLHGWGDSGSSWGDVAQKLSARFQVFLIDLPGFGASQAPPITWAVEQYREIIEQFIKEMEIEDPILLGHSHGGKIACELVAHGLSAKGVVLVASSGVDTPGIEVRIKVWFFKTCKWFLARCGGWGKKRLEQLRSKLGSRDYQEAGSLRETMVRVVNHKLFATLPKIKIPTLIIWGSEDSTLPMEQAKIFRAAIAGSYIRILWDATHHPHLEQPEELAEMVEDFCPQ